MSRTPLVWAMVALILSAAGARGADARDPLARARALYNEQKYDAAIAAAEQERGLPGRADSADLIAARAYLERFRASASADDLVHARDRLRRIDPLHFGVRERDEFIVGLGEALYLDEAFGAAAEIFDSVLGGPDTAIAPAARDRALDWWATALDRDARQRPELDRQAIYDRVRDRMRKELAAHPGSSSASYWAAAAPWAQGDLQTAWDAACSGWVRAPLDADHGAALRGDLDRLMHRGIIPDRARTLGVPPETLQADWERFKEQWTR